MDETTPPTVVVGVDGSELSTRALRWAADYARRIDGQILAVTAYEIPWTIVVTPTSTEEDYQREAHHTQDAAVEQALGPDPGVPVSKRMEGGRAAHVLTQAADGAALLVVGSHGRGEFPGMHLGSVAGYCVHHAPCPVLVYRGEHTGR